MGYSMIFRGPDTDQTLQVQVKPWPQVSLRRNITWAEDAAGYWHGCDRGAAGDFYDARVTVFGTASQMEDFADWVETNGRRPFEVSAFDGVIFPPIVDQSEPVMATITDLDRLRRVFFSYPSGVDEVTFNLRAIQPELVSSPGSSLEPLKLLEPFEQDKSTTTVKAFFQDGGASTADLRFDAGRFMGKFFQNTHDARAILRYLMGASIDPVGRALTFAFPALPGVTYPFGKARGGLSLNCKAKEVKIARISLDRWNLEIEFVEAP